MTNSFVVCGSRQWNGLDARGKTFRLSRTALMIVLALILLPWLLPARCLALELTPAEQQYLQSHRQITVCVDPNWAPFEVIDQQGQAEGIAADLLSLAAKRAGLQLSLVKTANWSESLLASKQQRCQLLNFTNKSTVRESWLIFTQPLFTDVNVFITREEHPFITDAHALSGESIVLPVGTSIEERIRADFPNLKIVHSNNDTQAFEMVSSRQADMTLRSLTVSAYTIRKEGWFNLKIAGQAQGYDSQFRIGVLREDKILRNILDQAIASITPAERNQIVNQHIAIKVEEPLDLRVVAQFALVFLAILIINIYWLIRLRRVNGQLRIKSETDTLTGLANRAELNRQCALLLAQAQQEARGFSVVLLDIDYFKQVNDELGHLIGDQVLVELAQVLTHTVRQSDIVGRWGGEEFLVLCPASNSQQAMRLAERLCAATREHAFGHPSGHTISAGVASIEAGDSIDSLLQRADTALYQAKNQGRDRACLAETSPSPTPAANS